MTDAAVASAPAATEKHPKGLYVLFSAEMWERFSFYSMSGMFVLYLRDATQGFGWDMERASVLNAYYLMFVYVSPLVGGWLADRWLGYRRSVVIGGFFFMAGHLLLAFHAIEAMYAALTCLVVGNGFFKPNVSTMVGNLYPQTSALKDRAFSIFYMGINIGALAAPIACEIVAQRYGYHPAFAMAAGGMVVSVGILTFLRRFIEAGDRRPGSGAPKVEPLDANDPIHAVAEWKRVTALVVVYLVGVAFWVLFWQNFSTLTDFADKSTDWSGLAAMVSDDPNTRITGILSNAINPAWIIVFGLVLTPVWRVMALRGTEPSTPTKMTLGLLCAAIAAFVMWGAAIAAGHTTVDLSAATKVSPWWLVVCYAFLSLGELLLSAMGLSLASKVAPARFRGLLMGGWFVSLGLGAYISKFGGQYWESTPHTKIFAAMGFLCLGATAVLFVLLRFLRKAMPGV
ncbi:MAG TPA: peptide MFS transporter [Planctomycetota bacterium]|nr:peptide MFS transporter [Planctomycetota bacterium]